MLEVKFYDSVDDSLLKFAVIISQSNGKWVFCKHKERDTYEVPGGHREAGENIVETAKRELQEETGAVKFEIKPICVYSVTGKTITAAWWIFMTLPLLKTYQQKYYVEKKHNAIRESFFRLVRTFQNVRKEKKVFLLGGTN